MPQENTEAPKTIPSLTVAVLGATGLVGSHLISILEERNFPLKTLKPLASQRSAGKHILFKGQEIAVELACPEAFEGVDIVLASAGGSVSETLVPEAVKRGCVVIDNTSCFRMNADVPLVVAGVNDDDAELHQGIIANPNCSTAQLMPVLKALHEAAGLKRVIVSTYQSVSGAGKAGMDELKATTHQCIHSEATEPKNLESDSKTTFQRPIAFNLIPHIDVFLDNDPVYGKDLDGYTKEEAKLICETRKILHLPDLKITATAVRVPVFIGHSESVTLDFDRALSPQKAERLLTKVPDVIVSESVEAYHTPAETAGTDPVYVSRIRRDNSNMGQGLNLWVVSDNLRIGAALNAVRIAEVLVQRDRLKPLPLPPKELTETPDTPEAELEELSSDSDKPVIQPLEPAKRHAIEVTSGVLQHVEEVEISAIESYDDFIAEETEEAEKAQNVEPLKPVDSVMPIEPLKPINDAQTVPPTIEPVGIKPVEIPMHPSLPTE